jgi:hypothetical protein
MKQPKIEIVTEPQPHEVEFVLQQIIKFNSSRASEGNYKHLVIFLRDSDDHNSGWINWRNILAVVVC